MVLHWEFLTALPYLRYFVRPPRSNAAAVRGGGHFPRGLRGSITVAGMALSANNPA